MRLLLGLEVPGITTASGASAAAYWAKVVRPKSNCASTCAGSNVHVRCGLLRASLEGEWQARALQFRSRLDIKTKQSGDTNETHETQTTHSSSCRRDRLSRADVRGRSGAGARQETQYPVHHGR